MGLARTACSIILTDIALYAALFELIAWQAYADGILMHLAFKSVVLNVV